MCSVCICVVYVYVWCMYMCSVCIMCAVCIHIMFYNMIYFCHAVYGPIGCNMTLQNPTDSGIITALFSCDRRVYATCQVSGQPAEPCKSHTHKTTTTTTKTNKQNYMMITGQFINITSSPPISHSPLTLSISSPW